MKILHLTNMPIPVNRESDAHFQDLDLLVATFGGKVISAFPLKRPTSFLPAWSYGMTKMKAIEQAVLEADIIYVHSPKLSRYRYLNLLQNKRVIYSVLTPASSPVRIKNVDHYIVHDKQTLGAFLQAGIEGTSLCPPKVSFKKDLLPVPGGDFTLLMSSSPWVKKQFRSKGIYLLLHLLDEVPDLRLTFIWRDILLKKMENLITASRHRDRIELVNGRVDVRRYMEQAHAVVLLAKDAHIVKSYPHSLLEGLLCGRPVITSSSIPISEDIADNDYGEVLASFDLSSLSEAVTRLRSGYNQYRNRVSTISPEAYSEAGFIDFHEKILKKVRK